MTLTLQADEPAVPAWVVRAVHDQLHPRGVLRFPATPVDGRYAVPWWARAVVVVAALGLGVVVYRQSADSLAAVVTVVWAVIAAYLTVSVVRGFVAWRRGSADTLRLVTVLTVELGAVVPDGPVRGREQIAGVFKVAGREPGEWVTASPEEARSWWRRARPRRVVAGGEADTVGWTVQGSR